MLLHKFHRSRIKLFSFMICSFQRRIHSSTSTSAWDPTISLSLKHPTLLLLEKCQSRTHFLQILCQMMRLHLVTQTFPMSRLLHFSAISQPENVDEAIVLFDHFTPHPNLYICNIMISALSFSLCRSVHVYKYMLSSYIYPNEQTFIAILKSCKNSSVGEIIHGHAVVFGCSLHIYVQNSLLKMYVENGLMSFAHYVFDQMHIKDIVSYNILISGYGKMGNILEAFKLFDEMHDYNIDSDQYTMVGILMCCGQLKNIRIGKSIHGWIIHKISLCDRGLILNNAILDMYAKFEDMNSAVNVFDSMNRRDGITWNIIISGFSSIGELELACKYLNKALFKDAISYNCLLAGYAREGNIVNVTKLFETMVSNHIQPDKVTAINLICAASETGILNQGRCIHGWALKEFSNIDAFLGSALVDMYSKCGSIKKSSTVFDTLAKKDVTLWTSMISSLAFHGHGSKALELFHRMQEEGFVPNSVTLLAVLTACSHAGLVHEGYTTFVNTIHEYKVKPVIEHYGCLVDLFARAGRLADAMNTIRSMPMKASASIWGSILNASKVHHNMELGEIALKELKVLEPEKEGGYVLLANIYANSEKWSESNEVRVNMGIRGIKKAAGYSSLVASEDAQEFVSADKRHRESRDIYAMLYHLHKDMRFGTEWS